ncbi:efflux RND transporter periplasmic adaptor subunit [candidate division KSB1 bacterium]
MSGKKKLIIASVVIIVIAVFVIGNLSKSEKTTEVTAEKATAGTIVEKVAGSGRVQPETEVNISAYVSAQITKLGVKEGDFVHEGQFLVQLDKTRYAAAVDQHNANLKSSIANAQLSNARMLKAKNDYDRIKKLYAAKLSSEAELQSYEADYLVAKAQYDSNLEQISQVQALLDQAQDDLAKTTILAPMTGTISMLNSEEGEVVLGTGFSQGTLIMTVADLTKMEVLCEIDENDVVNVKVGDESEIEIDAFPDTVFTGKVTEIAHSALTRGRGTQEEVTNFEVKIAILNKISSSRPGMSASVEIKTRKIDNIVKVPIQAVTARLPSDLKKDISGDNSEVSGNGGNGENIKTYEKEEPIEVVFVIKDGKVEAREVITGISDDTHIQIISGINDGEDIVTGSYKILSKSLKNGELVKIEEKKN